LAHLLITFYQSDVSPRALASGSPIGYHTTKI